MGIIFLLVLISLAVVAHRYKKQNTEDKLKEKEFVEIFKIQPVHRSSEQAYITQIIKVMTELYIEKVKVLTNNKSPEHEILEISTKNKEVIIKARDILDYYHIELLQHKEEVMQILMQDHHLNWARAEMGARIIIYMEEK